MEFIVLLLLGALLFIIGLIGFIIAFFRKRPKKKTLILVVLSLVLLTVGGVGTTNSILQEEYHGKLTLSDLLYMKKLQQPLTEAGESLDRFNDLVDKKNTEDKAWRKEMKEASADLIGKGEKLKAIKTSHKDGFLYQNVQEGADKLIEVGQMAPKALLSGDTDKEIALYDKLLEAAKNFSTIESAL